MSNARELAELGGSYGTGGFVGMKNRIINGRMGIDQRNSGASLTPTDGAYSLDRWRFQVSQASKLSVQQRNASDSGASNYEAGSAPAGYTNSMKITSLSAYSSISTDYFWVFQAIEGFNTQDLAWGTANAATVTLSFWVKSSLTGAFGGAIAAYTGTTRTYPFSFTISAANTWEQKSITIAGDTSGTYSTNDQGSFGVYINLGTGSNRQGTANAWSGSDYRGGATGSTSVIGTNGATFYITGVQLEKGSTATSFDYRPYGTELQLCQRYYRQFGTSTSRYIVSSNVTSGSTYYWAIVLNPYMRTGPTVTISDESNSNIAPSAIIESTEDKFWLYGVASATARGYIQCKLTASAEL